MFTELFPGLALEELALEELSLEELAREELALEELAREALAGLRSLVGEPEFLSFRGLLSLSLGGQGSETNKKPLTAKSGEDNRCFTNHYSLYYILSKPERILNMPLLIKTRRGRPR